VTKAARPASALGTLFNVSGTIVNVLVALAASGAARWTRDCICGAGARLEALGLLVQPKVGRVAEERRRPFDS
jgi:hypothetical protein